MAARRNLSEIKDSLDANPAFGSLLDGDAVGGQKAVIPEFTTTARNALGVGARPRVIFNTTTNKLNIWNGTAWEAVTSA